MRAAAPHLREENRRHCRHVGGLRARDPGNEVHRAEKDIGQTAFDMTDQRREEIHHHPRDPGHLHQQAEDDEHWHGEQQQVRNSVIHPVDDDNERQVGGQRQVRESGDAKGEGDRHSDHHAGGDEYDKEQDQAAVAHRDQQWLRQ